MTMLDEDQAWRAVECRDGAMDGGFVYAVRTTGVYCRPACPARRPARAHVAFFSDGAAARAAGFRACRRCRPDEAARDRLAVARAVEMIEAAQDDRLALEPLARAVGYSPAHFQRLFRRQMGCSPAAYGRARRMERFAAALQQGGDVTAAIYEAGYGSASAAYAAAKEGLGMTPSAYRDGGAGAVIRYAPVDSDLGPLLIAASERGLCRIAFDEGEEDLRARFPRARLIRDEDGLRQWGEALARLVAGSPHDPADLPLDAGGTAFQAAVWQALRAIPPGETRSYGEIARAVGRPDAVRAVGSACGANPLAVLVPCHRVLRRDGAPGGYAWGLARKRALLDRERGEG